MRTHLCLRLLVLFCLAMAADSLQAGSGALNCATYLGGDGSDLVNAMTVDASNNIYLTGFTLSSNFPVTVGALPQPTPFGFRGAR